MVWWRAAMLFGFFFSARFCLAASVERTSVPEHVVSGDVAIFFEGGLWKEGESGQKTICNIELDLVYRNGQ